MPRLLIVGEDGSERVVELTERTLQIGRGPGNDIVLADPSQGVSRTHAELRFRGGRSVIVDLQSQNGTWLNGQRVEHAEVPPDAEIAVGNYRLRILPGDPPRAPGFEPPGTAHVAAPADRRGSGSGVSVSESAFPDVPLVRSYESRLPHPPPKSRMGLTQTLLLAGFVVAVAAFTWRMLGPARADLAGSTTPPVQEPAEPVSVPAAEGANGSSPAVAEAAGLDPATSASSPKSLPPAAELRPAPQVTVRPDAPPVARRPGESSEAWRTRTAAFQTRYLYSRAALDRGDFAAAAGGFEAILREEPGFMDVPQLLLRARAGLRAAAVDVFETGQRLEAAGEWLGALQKYEQARQVHPDVPGLSPAIRRVREKLRVAGTNALARARQLDQKGQAADALKEYEKAVQWLPPDDPNRGAAETRVDQLKRSIR